MAIRPRSPAGEPTLVAPASPSPEASPAPAPTPPPVEAEPAPASPPPETAPATTPAPEPETAPVLEEPISDADLTSALKIAKRGGANQKSIEKGLKVSSKRAKAILAEMEAKGIIGPRPSKLGEKRKILLEQWPPEVEPAPEPASTEPAPNAPPAEPPAEPDPAEPAPGEAPPATPETPPAAPETDKRGFFRRAFDRFTSKFRGEVQPEEEKDYKGSWGDVGRNVTLGLMSVVASYTGVKFFVDLGAKGWQTLVSNPAERRRIQNALLAKERELGETTEPSAIDQKKAKLEEAINASKFLTKEKKADLLTTLSEIVEIYKESTGAAIKARDKEILEKLEKAIQTRVKNTQLLKEGLNTALMATGLAAMRGVAYGAVASYERYKQVAQERTEGKRRGTQFNEWIVKGFTETLHNLVGGKEKFFSTKGAMNVVKGATNVLRAAGFADLAISEYLEEGGPSKMIEASLKAWEEKSPTEFLTDNIQDQWKRLASLGKYAKTAIAGLQSEPGVTPEIPDELPADADDGSTVPEEVVTAGAVGAAGVAAAESARHVEAPEVHVEENLVKKGDGIIKVLERQGVPKTSAIEAAQEAGIIRAGGDTRLTTQAIGRLSVFTETQPDGDLEIKFVDTKTDKVLTLAQAREAGFTYESGTVPGELATEEEVASHVPETAGVFKDSPDVPNDLLEGTFHLYTDSEGNFTYLDPGAGDKLVRMNEALQELAKQDHEQSPEAKFIWQQYERHLLAIEGVQVDAPLPPDTAPVAPQAAVGQQSALPETQGDTEPLRKFDGEAGVVKFVYDKTTGEVKDAFLPAYTPGKTEIRDSLKEWGLTPQEVKEKFEQDHGGAWSGDSHPDRYPPGERPGASIQSAANDYRQFTREVTKLSRQESLLREMEEQGFARTPEYARVKMETEELETFISRQMEKIFHIKERSI